MTGRQELRELCAFQLGLEDRLKTAGVDGTRRQILLDLARQLGENPRLQGEQLMGAVKQAAAHHMQEEQQMDFTVKTAEDRQADAFELGIGLMLKEAQITDPQKVQQFMQFAARLAAEESAEG